MTGLPRIKIGRKVYFFDRRLSELRNINNPHDRESVELAYAPGAKWLVEITKC